ncbi:RNA ligase family protein [Xanthomonas translucens]|uniref:RNA ligase domain-containing protein n=1 Tax=Xanthomonas translucens pv. translucens DSM 18974 TaxID=1261556 RepID=A0A1C3TKV7_XANCT|nr:RNA ligase family protein [Xanthomonas translucens]MCC8448248.1 RNA ligase family protein [Xanthomonas translucens pv. translucens]MCS3361145.1 RNA ligase family protein [Xanthomonas translucens pv. translucens]MCS3374898.1 RNA ligase family protein [Xanthomonas translucens pv. translucens]MCT8275887.1 RNA ligase family protein [Xanthomonas translucens pv. translucens]MCT8279523.1 RNA ligase family protein [Xanthomonas translucens pv. translucens]
MTDFFRFPHTPHLAWLGEGSARDDKVLSPAETTSLLAGEVVVEEKLDGANLGFSFGPGAHLRVQNRGQYLTAPHSGQFERLPPWLTRHADALLDVLTPELLLFGEWCAARHSLDYVALPDWFLLFDVYDRSTGRFWSTPRRNALAKAAALATVPNILQGRTTLSALQQQTMSTPSRYRSGQPLEGVIVRRESTEWCEARAKLVRPDFTQAMDIHWRKRAIEWNLVDHAAMAKT